MDTAMDPGTHTTPGFSRENSLVLQRGRISCDAVVIQASLDLRPAIVEICYYPNDKQMLPQTRVRNKRIRSSQ